MGLGWFYCQRSRTRSYYRFCRWSIHWNGEISNIKNSTLFPQTWSDQDIIDSIKSVGEDVPLAIRTSDGATFHRKSINGVSIDVIKRGPDVISG
ncbi:TPA: EndoU domain-containing protein [Streptococcus suis]|nr:EndoU domain-containing protein [Streptococcus suis]